MTLPVVLSEDDLAAIMAAACANPCRDARQQQAMEAVAAHLDPLFVDWRQYVADSWATTPCPVCDAPVGRDADPVCGECRAQVWGARR